MRRSNARLIFIMGIVIPGKSVFILRRNPGRFVTRDTTVSFATHSCRPVIAWYQQLSLKKWSTHWKLQPNDEEHCALDIDWNVFVWLIYIFIHDDVIKWRRFPWYWPLVRGIHRSPVNSPHKGQWRGALVFSLICAWINGWVNNRETGDLRRHRAHYDVIVMLSQILNGRVWW